MTFLQQTFSIVRPCSLVLLTVCLGMWQPARADEALSTYFDQLRQRNLFTSAEGYAMARLGQPNLPRARRVQLVIELSRTLATHAEFATQSQQQELWTKARQVLEDQQTREPTSPFNILLTGHAALIPAMEAEWLITECDLRPFDEHVIAQTRQACNRAVELLSASEKTLLSPPKEAANKNSLSPGPTSHEIRVLMHRVRLALAQTLRNRATLSPADSQQRTVDVIDAEQTARKLISSADEPIPSQAKLLLASCMRLKGELARADEMLTAFEKSQTALSPELSDAVAAERARILLDRHQAPDALEVILQVRTKRQRLTGELWYLRTRALASLRDIAVSRKDMTLANKLSEEAEVTLQRCDEQVGGFWSRRCRQLWSARQTAEKYGPELDGVMQQARADFLANRIEPSLAGYARGEQIARTSGQQDLAFELGYTRASILLKEKQFQAAATEFSRLANEHSQNARAAASHLNGAYCLGRLYDEQKSQARREAYTHALDQHIERFASDPTADDARFFKAQLEEQRLQATVALPLYLKVDSKHPRSWEARAGAARCYETILTRMRELKKPAEDFQRTAIDTLNQIMASLPSDAKWDAAQCEVALHLGAILLSTEPPVFEQSEQLFANVMQSANAVPSDDEQIERWRRLRQRAETLRVVALAGHGRPAEAERMIDSLGTASPRDLVVIVERLTALIDTPNRQRQIQYVNLLLRATEQLGKHASDLSREDQEQLDRSLGKAYLTSGQTSKALEIYQRQAAVAPRDVDRQREIAVLASKYDQREFMALSRQCWRRVESLSKQGSEEWLTARLGVITTSMQLNELAEARKLFGITKLLYRDLGNDDLKARFAAVESKLDSMK